MAKTWPKKRLQTTCQVHPERNPEVGVCRCSSNKHLQFILFEIKLCPTEKPWLSQFWGLSRSSRNCSCVTMPFSQGASCCASIGEGGMVHIGQLHVFAEIFLYYMLVMWLLRWSFLCLYVYPCCKYHVFAVQLAF